MTPEERDRLVKAEAQIDASMSASTGSRPSSTNSLAAAMGKGAFWILMKMGGVLAIVAGAVAWAADHFRWWIK